MMLFDYNPVQYTKVYFEILVYHENLVTISFILSIEFFFCLQRNCTKSCQKPLKYIVTAIVRGGSRHYNLTLDQLLYWTGP